MTADHDDDDAVTYDPHRPSPPAREPPHRSTAPQSKYTMGQVGIGLVVLLVGTVVTVGLPLLL